MHETGAIRISGVSERDLDLLLLEEFISSPQFLKWFVNQVGYSQLVDVELIDVQRSVTHSTGESDLEVTLLDKKRRAYTLLIENKIGANFQYMQADRYRQRGDSYKKQGKIFDYRTILIAPDRYFSRELKGFDARVNYEAIAEWFSQQALLGNRRSYKLSLLNSAVEKSVTGYQSIADDAVTLFWLHYWKLVSEIAKEFEMSEPPARPARSSFIPFPRAGLPKGVLLVHKVVHGHFDIQFAGYGDRLRDLREKFAKVLEADMRIEKANKSAVIRIKVPKLSTADPFDEQRDKAIEAVITGKRLYKWLLDNLMLAQS